MAQNYETTVQVNSFGGFYQGAGEYIAAMKYAADGKNFSVRGGQLHSMDDGAVHTSSLLPAPIGTLMLLYRRFNKAEFPLADDPALLVAASGGKIYARSLSASPTDQWQEIYSGITNDRMDYVTYETSVYYVKNMERVSPCTPGATEVVATDPIDILIMTNADDGMFIVYGDSLDVVPYTVQPTGAEEQKFGVLARHAERIWGSAIPGTPDKLMYSTPFEPFNWEANPDYPEDGAGDIMQPSWDGDSFVALRTYGSYLMAIKKNRIWRIAGTNPGEYYFKEQFGGGTLVENTVVVYNDLIFMLSYEGLMVYDGTAVQPFRQEYVRGIMNRLNWEKADGAVAAMRGAVYCLALPLDGSEINNAILEYDTEEKSFTLREGVYASSFLAYEDKLYYTDVYADDDADSYGKIMVLDGTGNVLPMRYVTAYQDIGYKSCTKSGFEVYVMADTAITITIGIRTEKKLKTRTVTLVPGKVKKVRLNVSGRKFRLEVDVPSFVDDDGLVRTPKWTLCTGLQINMELDWD